MPSQTSPATRRVTGLIKLLVCTGLSGLVGLLAKGATPAANSVSSDILTNIYEMWTIPQDQRHIPRRIRTEMVIYYFDSEWNVAWGECGGRPTFLPIADSPVPMKTGQRVWIEGVIEPARERFDWQKTRVQVMGEGVEVLPKPVRELGFAPEDLRAQLVSVEGLIDRLSDELTHVNVDFLAAGIAAKLRVLKGTNAPAPRFKEGDFVRVKSVYAPEFDRDGRLRLLTLWASQPADVQVIGSLATDSRFSLPVAASESIQQYSPTGSLVRVVGTVRRQELGKWVTLWDATGQIMVQSEQTLPLRFGERVEAIGYPYVVGVQQCLRGGLYRPAISSPETGPQLPEQPSGHKLRLAEQVREMHLAEAALHRPVELQAIVTFSHADAPFAFVQDASGGVRLVNPSWDGEETRKPGTLVRLTGVTAAGGFVPVVTNAVLQRSGWWELGAADPVTLEQALTGVEDGHWIEMRGYVRRLVVIRGLMRLDLSTPGGEFEAWAPAHPSLNRLIGSVARMQGVCASVSNERHQLTGIQLWLPDFRFAQIEADAPEDPFSVPFRAIGDLRRFNLDTALNRRVRTAGTVVFSAPGRYLYVQDGTDSVLALCQQTDPLRPGDRIEVVGFPGNKGRRLLLREAVFRKSSAGPEPAPAELPRGRNVNLELEGLLAQAEGRLLNLVAKDGETRLLIQDDDLLFEASLEKNPQGKALPEVNSRLMVTGVYEVQSDEYGQPSSFLLRLRSPADVRVIQHPPWWTLARLWWMLLAVVIVSAAALIWGALSSKKNRLLEQAQTDLRQANDKLEQRVSERTRELESQVAAMTRARLELAQAQESLLLASRKAGMAEVATGVLHNVGNVLNSVNVSASVVQERLRQFRIESVARTAALLHAQNGQLDRFFAEDEKGKALPAYLDKLAENLAHDKRVMQAELESLTRNIDHIKIVVAMQQDYARAGGLLEELQLSDLVEDALQINIAALHKPGIQVVRDYQAVPRVLVDRHKVLQILINLINNAKHALEGEIPDKRLTLSILSVVPDRVQVCVRDNGIGIASENLNRIFSQGFTTRKDGHGFGLHSGANAAKELGGSLKAQSDGPGHGATFTLELPVVSRGSQVKQSS